MTELVNCGACARKAKHLYFLSNGLIVLGVGLVGVSLFADTVMSIAALDGLGVLAILGHLVVKMKAVDVEFDSKLP